MIIIINVFFFSLHPRSSKIAWLIKIYKTIYCVISRTYIFGLEMVEHVRSEKNVLLLVVFVFFSKQLIGDLQCALF